MDSLSVLFVDTSYVLGLYNADDRAHKLCVEISKNIKKADKLITTDAILMEIGNTFSVVQKRQKGSKIIRDFLKMKRMNVVHLSPEYFEESLKLYEKRPDKEWGMVDCFSFVVMEKYNIKTALTLDHHFKQAGFTILTF